MNLKSAIRQCPTPDVLGIKDGKQNGKLIGVAGAVDGPSKSIVNKILDSLYPLVLCKEAGFTRL